MIDVKLPPLQRKLLDALMDGHVHTHEQLKQCADDPKMVNGVLGQNIKKLRDVLRRETCFDIATYAGEGYRLVRAISDK